MSKRGCLIVGASGGLGHELSLQMAGKGWRLFAHGRDEEKLNRLSEQLDTEIVKIKKNFLSRSDIHDFMDLIYPYADLLDVAIVSFGPFLENSLASMSSDQYEHIFDMNLLLPSLIITALAPRMAERNWGRIIVFGGTGTDQNRSYRHVAAYSAAKYALNSMVRSAALEFGKRGVTVNVICPGYVKTEYYDQKVLDNLKQKGLLLEPERISDIVDFLVSARSSAINGAVINAGTAAG